MDLFYSIDNLMYQYILSTPDLQQSEVQLRLVIQCAHPSLYANFDHDHIVIQILTLHSLVSRYSIDTAM